MEAGNAWREVKHVAKERRRGKSRTDYRPKLEALEALRLLDAAASTLLAVPVELPPTALAEPSHDADSLAGASSAAALLSVRDRWDLAIEDGAWFGEPDHAVVDERAIEAGLNQLNRYLASAWSRAGIGSQHRDDCTQAVHATLLQQVGRQEFDALLAGIGRTGVSQVLNRDTSLGPDFFRAVDMVKKRAQRQRTFVPLDDALEMMSPSTSWEMEPLRNALDEAIEQKLDTREADLIRATLKGFTPAEIAQQWGLAPKTVSNEKTRVFQKLREALTAELADR